MKGTISTVILLFFCQTIFSQFPDYVQIMKCNESEFQSKNYFIVDFWTSYCAPCTRSFPHIKAVHKKLKRSDIGFISITNQTEKKVDEFLQQNEITGCVGVDKEFRLLEKYGYKTIPRLFIIDKEGNVLWSGMPFELQENLVIKIINSQESDKKISSFYSNVKIERTHVVDSSYMGHSEDSELREVNFTNHSVTDIYKNILKLRDEIDHDIIVEGSPRYGGNLNYSCKVDVDHYSSDQFFDYCLENLNAAYNAKLRDTLVPAENIFFKVSNVNKLMHNRSLNGEQDIDINKSNISLKHTTLKNYFSFISSYYDIHYELAANIKALDKERYNITIKRVSLENLNSELEEIGLSMKMKEGMKKEYVLSFN